MSREFVIKELLKRHEQDVSYESGRILGSMLTSTPPIAREAYNIFLDTNLGDPDLCDGAKSLENEVIGWLGNLLGNPDAIGYILTGGTEANLMAMVMAKKIHGDKNAEIIVPKSAHFSFDKIEVILGIKVLKANLNGLVVDVDSVKRLINEHTCAIVGVAGTTEFGAIDPIPELSDLALDNNLYLHVDAAFGGFVIPFLKDLNYEVPDFDFGLKGVSSITIDPHKMGLAPIPAGGILFRDETYLRGGVDTPYIGLGKQFTPSSTRSGASVAATWTLMRHLGREGYRKIVHRCMEHTRLLADGASEFAEVIPPVMNVVAIKIRDKDLSLVVKRLEELGWKSSVTRKPPCIRVVVMPHLTEHHINEFLRDLRSVVLNLE